MSSARFSRIFYIKDNEAPISWLIFPAGFELAYFPSEDVRTVSCYPVERENKSGRVSREWRVMVENIAKGKTRGDRARRS